MRRIFFLAMVALVTLLPTVQVSAQTADDRAMAQRIGNSLKDSGQLRNYRVDVKFQDGVVWLSGNVADEQQLATAIRLTRNIPGVSHVVSRLSVAGQGGQAGYQQTMQAAYAPQPSGNLRNNNSAASRLRPGSSRNQNAGGGQNSFASARSNMPVPAGYMAGRSQPQGPIRPASATSPGPAPSGYGMSPMPSAQIPGGTARAVNYDSANMPGYAWPSYASHPNYAALTYPKQYSASAWPYIGPFYPYPQVPLGWRKISLEWDDGWWFLDFSDASSNH